jgi:hypothetical protein
MIKDLGRRRKFWDKAHSRGAQGQSDPKPFLEIPDWEDYFKNKDVLEIGPGDKRQSEDYTDMCNSYSIADISTGVLEKHDCNKYLIRSYNVNFEDRFDTIALWYVLHHVLLDEGTAFMGFLLRHLKKDGTILLNAPIREKGGYFGDDGEKTTSWTSELLDEFISKYKLECVFKKCVKENNNIYVLRRGNV